MLEESAPYRVLNDMGAKEQSAMFHPASGEWTQAGFVNCTVPSDGWAKEVLMSPNDAAFTIGARHVLPGGKDARLPLEKGQL